MMGNTCTVRGRYGETWQSTMKYDREGTYCLWQVWCTWQGVMKYDGEHMYCSWQVWWDMAKYNEVWSGRDVLFMAGMVIHGKVWWSMMGKGRTVCGRYVETWQGMMKYNVDGTYCSWQVWWYMARCDEVWWGRDVQFRADLKYLVFLNIKQWLHILFMSMTCSLQRPKTLQNNNFQKPSPHSPLSIFTPNQSISLPFLPWSILSLALGANGI